MESISTSARMCWPPSRRRFDMLAQVRSWWRALTGRSRLDGEMASEMDSHIERYAADLAAGGVEPGEARRRARIEFGSAADLHRRGSGHAGSLHRREYGHLQRGGRRTAAAVTLSPAGAAGHDCQILLGSRRERLRHGYFRAHLGSGARQRHLSGRGRVQRRFEGRQLRGWRARRVRQTAARLGRFFSRAGNRAVHRTRVRAS